MEEKEKKFRSELANLMNVHGKDNDTNIPDFLLAEMVGSFLVIIGAGVNARDQWFRFDPRKQISCSLDEPKE